MDWNECWRILREELGRDPTASEVIDKMLSSEFNGDKDELV